MNECHCNNLKSLPQYLMHGLVHVLHTLIVAADVGRQAEAGNPTLTGCSARHALQHGRPGRQARWLRGPGGGAALALDRLPHVHGRIVRVDRDGRRGGQGPDGKRGVWHAGCGRGQVAAQEAVLPADGARPRAQQRLWVRVVDKPRRATRTVLRGSCWDSAWGRDEAGDGPCGVMAKAPSEGPMANGVAVTSPEGTLVNPPGS